MASFREKYGSLAERVARTREAAPVAPSAQEVFDSHYQGVLAANPDRDPEVLKQGILAVHEGGALPGSLPTVLGRSLMRQSASSKSSLAAS